MYYWHKTDGKLVANEDKFACHWCGMDVPTREATQAAFGPGDTLIDYKIYVCELCREAEPTLSGGPGDMARALSRVGNILRSDIGAFNGVETRIVSDEEA